MIRSFTVVIERDPESGWLVGDVLELSGCYTQAPDRPTLAASLHEAITAYLKTSEPEEPLPDFVGTLQVEVKVAQVVISRMSSQVISPGHMANRGD